MTNKIDNEIRTGPLKNMSEKLFRMMIFGSSQSGKTYLLLHKLLPLLSDHYDSYVIFTRKFNIPCYKKAFRNKNMKGHKPIFFTDISEILNVIKKIENIQEKNIKGYDSEGEPIYKNKILFVFDDIIKEKLMKTDDFLEVFVNLRHLYISTILLSQIVSKAITTDMKASTNYFIFFALNDPIHQRMPINLIKGCLSKKYPDKKISWFDEHAKKIYNQKCMYKKYGYLIIDDSSELY